GLCNTGSSVMNQPMHRLSLLTVVMAGLSAATAAVSQEDRRAAVVPQWLEVDDYVGMHIRTVAHHALWVPVPFASSRLHDAHETASGAALAKRHSTLHDDARRMSCVVSSQSVWVCRVSGLGAQDLWWVSASPQAHPANWHAIGVRASGGGAQELAATPASDVADRFARDAMF